MRCVYKEIMNLDIKKASQDTEIPFRNRPGRALSIVYQDKLSSVSELFQKDNSVTMHQRNLQVLATELKWTWLPF